MRGRGGRVGGGREACAPIEREGERESESESESERARERERERERVFLPFLSF